MRIFWEKYTKACWGKMTVLNTYERKGKGYKHVSQNIANC